MAGAAGGCGRLPAGFLGGESVRVACENFLAVFQSIVFFSLKNQKPIAGSWSFKYLASVFIAFQENIASNPAHQNSKSGVSQLRRAPARLLLSSLAFEPCCAVFAAIFSWNAIVSLLFV